MGFLVSVAIVATIFSFCIYVLIFKDMELNTITFDQLTSSPYLSDEVLLFLRLIMTSVIWSTIIFSVFIDKVGIKVNVQAREKGKTKFMHIFGFGRLAFFTWWSWTLEGIYFLLITTLSVIRYSRLSDNQSSSNLISISIQTTWILFEINFTVASLVSMIVTYVLIPGNKKADIPTDVFFQPIALLTHNANIIFMAFEIIFNNLNFSIWHVVYAILYSMSYVLFSWFWFNYGPGVFYYFFLDYARNDSHIWYIGLCSVFAGFFYFGYFISYLQQYSAAAAMTLVMAFVYLAVKLTDSK